MLRKPCLQPRGRRVEQRACDALVVDGLEEAIEANAIMMLFVMHIILDRPDPSDRLAVRPSRRPVLCFRVLEERILRRTQQRAHVATQLRYPQWVVAVVVVREGDEAIEIAPVGDGNDLQCGQMTPSSFPRRPKTASARSIWSAV